MLPQGTVPEPDPVDDTPPREEYLERIVYRQRRTSLRVRILVFSVVAGGLLSAVMSFVTAVMIYASSEARGVFGGESRMFLPTFFPLWASTAPMMMLLAAVAAATELLVKRSARSSHQTADDLAEAIHRLAREIRTEPRRTQSSGPELNLEIDDSSGS
jgi:hypothetical protein